MKLGDLVHIWSGDGSIFDRKNWTFGMVVKRGKRKVWGRNETRYKVLWCDSLRCDDVWYRENEIRIDE